MDIKKYSSELLSKMYRYMHLVRSFEEHLQWLFSKGMVYGTAHFGIGEEATCVGTVFALKEQDYLFGNHRGHGQAIAKEVDIDAMMCEILAKANGCCKGKGGSLHIADPSHNYFSCDGILGANPVICGGTALAIKKRGETDRIACVMLGDGAANEGAFYEAMNLAAVWNLPVLFIVVNNTYGMSTPLHKVMKDTDISKRAIPFAMPSRSIDGNNVLEVYETIQEAREYVRKNGPMLVVENTYRTCGHSKSDGNLYRSKEEIAAWKEKCPIKALAEKMIEAGIATAEELAQIEKEAKERIDRAEEFALASPEPRVEDIFEDVYA